MKCQQTKLNLNQIQINKQDLKFHLKEDLKRLENSVLRVIAKFPDDKNWGMRHVRVAVNKLVENPELSVEQVIKKIKRSYLCVDEGWFVDKGNEFTFQKELKNEQNTCPKDMA